MTEIRYPEIGVCGLSCPLCPHYYTEGESRCGGCKTEGRMKAGCPFITCAVKRRGIEFCWECAEQEGCERWAHHRARGREHDTFVSYQGLEANIARAKAEGLDALVRDQEARRDLLVAMVEEFNDGRSKTYYSVAATVMTVEEMEGALAQARAGSATSDRKERAARLRALLDALAKEKGYPLRLRK